MGLRLYFGHTRRLFVNTPGSQAQRSLASALNGTHAALQIGNAHPVTGRR